MNIGQIRQVSTNFYNNFYQDMLEFSQMQNGCQAIVITRALNDDLQLENEIHRVVPIILNRINQLAAEVDNFNNIQHNFIIDNNRWVNFRDNARLFYRTMSVLSGFLLVDQGQINIPFDVQNNIFNHLGIDMMLNVENQNVNNNYQIN